MSGNADRVTDQYDRRSTVGSCTYVRAHVHIQQPRAGSKDFPNAIFTVRSDREIFETAADVKEAVHVSPHLLASSACVRSLLRDSPKLHINKTITMKLSPLPLFILVLSFLVGAHAAGSVNFTCAMVGMESFLTYTYESTESGVGLLNYNISWGDDTVTITESPVEITAGET